MLEFIFFHLAEPPFRAFLAISLWVISQLYGLSEAIRTAVMSRVLFDHRALAAPANNKPHTLSKGKNSGWTERVKEKQVEQSEEEIDPADKMCPICHEEIGTVSSEGTLERWSVLPCGHVFGDECIKQYIRMVAYDRPQCPICRCSLVHGCGHPVLPALLVGNGSCAHKVNRETIRALVTKSMQYNCGYCTEMIASGRKMAVPRHGRKRQRTSKWKTLLKRLFSSPMDRWSDPEFATARFEHAHPETRFGDWYGGRDYEWEWWWDRQVLTIPNPATSTK